MNQKPLTIEDICNKLRPIFGKKIDEIYFQYTVANGYEEREEIAHILNTLYQKHLKQLLDKSVLLEPPKKELIDGTYNLATIVYANKEIAPFNLREQDWPRHICVTGMSGSGKTTFAFKIVESLNAHKKPYLIFDWKKSFRPILTEDPSVLIFTIGDEKVSNLFKTNINQPPKNVSPKEWINVLSDLLTESFQASFGVHKVILETLDEAFKEWGIYHGSENYPTWNHIKWRLEEKLEKANNRESGWLESALRIATVLTFGEFGKTLNYKGNNSISIGELLDKKIIMELSSLGGVEKTFFCEFILTYIYKLEKAKQNPTSHEFNHAIIVDEAHNIFLKKRTNFANETITDMIYREMREYGTSLICLDQHISKISDTVKGNSACHIAFQQQLPQDIQDISEITQLRDSRHYFSSLPVGSAIVKLSERYNQPFQIKVPYTQIRDKNVTSEKIKSRMQAFICSKEYKENSDPEFNKQIENPPTSPCETSTHTKPVTQKKHPTNPVQTTDHQLLTNAQQTLYNFITEHLNAGIPLEQIENILEKSKTQGNYTSTDIIQAINLIFANQLVKNQPSTPNTLNHNEQAFLKFLQQNPNHNLSTTQIYEQVKLSARKGTATKKSLEQKGLIKIEEIKYEKGWKKIIRLT
ncbi:ATP-binding protein [Candidatus Pacearchaeota archaeon]|nr:ATP-binding protein [Candidatus Pacearchaeota archaeon]